MRGFQKTKFQKLFFKKVLSNSALFCILYKRVLKGRAVRFFKKPWKTLKFTGFQRSARSDDVESY